MRDIEVLEPEAREAAHAMLDLARQADFDLLIYCTTRTLQEQARLYRRGRTGAAIERRARELDKEWKRPDLAFILLDVGPQMDEMVVTHAGPGQSLHNYGMAFDGCPMRDGKPVWGTHTDEDIRAWATYGDLGRQVGLEWAGTWMRFQEYPHLQVPGRSWKEMIGLDVIGVLGAFTSDVTPAKPPLPEVTPRQPLPRPEITPRPQQPEDIDE